MINIQKAYIYQLKTNSDIEHKLTRFCGSARFLWNKSLAMNLERLHKRQSILWYNELAFWLTLWKRSDKYGFLKECPSRVLQQKLRDLDRAFRDCFDKSQSYKHLPVFKKKGGGDGIRFPQGFKIDNRRIFLPKNGWVGFFKSCSVQGKVKNITVSFREGWWYVSIQVEQAVEIGKHPSDSEIGIDAGISCFAALSDGTMVEGIHSFRRHEDRMAREQRKLSRQQKGSKNWKKQKQKISRLHHTIANVRQDFLHKSSAEISESQAKVYMEGLQIRNMSASARGIIEEPGRNVKTKSGLNKAILDQGWFELTLLAASREESSIACLFILCSHNSKGSLNTNSTGKVACWLKSITGIPLKPAHVAGTGTRRTGYPGLYSNAWPAGMKRMLI